LRYVE